MDDTETADTTTTEENQTLQYPTFVIEKPIFEISEVIIVIIAFVAFVLSIISMIFHLLKFFRSTQKQNLHIKNLTSYCVCLLILYVFSIFYTAARYTSDDSLILKLIATYIHLTECLLILIMAIHTCLGVIYGQNSYHFSLPDGNKFLLYSIVGWILPIPLAVVVLRSEPTDPPILIGTLLIRLLVLIPCFLSLWFIRSIGWNRSSIVKDFSIYKRILIFTAIVSITPNVSYGISLLFETDSSFRNVFTWIANDFYTFEGLIVGLYFTFRKDTFENQTKNATEMTRGYVTDD